MTISFARRRVYPVAAALAVALMAGFAFAADQAPAPAARPAQPAAKPAQQPAQPQAAKPAQQPAVSQPAVQQPAAQQQTRPAQPQQGGQPQINKITEAVIKGGVSRCANRVNQVTNFLVQQSSGYGAFNFMPPSNPNTQLFSSSLEISSPNQPPAYASATFAPSEAGCGGMYEVVIYWPGSCNEVFKTQFAGMKQIGAIAKGIPILGGTGNARVFLMPAGTGCVSIKKEVVW